MHTDNIAHLWNSLVQMAQIGAASAGDCIRRALRGFGQEIGTENIPVDSNEIWHFPAAGFDSDCVEAVRTAADVLRATVLAHDAA